MLARSVSSGDASACEQFVGEYSDFVISRVWNLMKTHCHQPAKEKTCVLIILRNQKNGLSYSAPDQCDECMDSYIWFFDFLKGKMKAYKGNNNCTLKTFVWSVANSHPTYVEWLRWRYGRAF
jgi:hypothetical protein